MKAKLKHYSKETLSFLIILFVVSNAISYYRGLDLNKEKFNLKNIILINNTKFTYDKNKPLLVHFWATWCPICKIEAPNIQELSKNYNVLTIATDSGDDNNINKYLKEQNINFSVLNDKDYKLSHKFNIQVFPTTLIYDNNSELKFIEVGYSSTWGLKIRMWWLSL